MTQLREAVVLITGATGGFGQELTRQLLKAGSRLILTDLDQTILHQRSEVIQNEILSSPLNEQQFPQNQNPTPPSAPLPVYGEGQGMGFFSQSTPPNKTGKILACLAADLASREGCEALYQQVNALEVPVDILINNAGIGLFGRMDEVPSEKWERLMQVNLLTPMRLSTLFAADMIARQKGHIVNISSLAGWSAQAGMAHYAASKFGLRGFSEGLFNEVKAYNVKVTAVYPFFSRTPILQSERYGTLGAGMQGFPEHLATEPADVIRETIRGIVRNQLHVFPDAIAKNVHLLKRYSPSLLDWLSNRFNRRLNSGTSQ